MNVTPAQISELEPNEVFVFGSNLQGYHGGGAARFAVLKFGAIMGQPVGMQGQSYAIPTLSEPLLYHEDLERLKLSVGEIRKYVNKFLMFAYKHPELYFYVTPIGCGIAGFSEQEIAPLFANALKLKNVALPQSFLDILGVNNNLNEHKHIRISEQELRKIVRNIIKESLS